MATGVLGGDAGALIGRADTAGVDILGAEVTLTSGGAGSWGGWTQVVASAASELLVVGFVLNYDSGPALDAARPSFLRVGAGGSGSEVALGATAGPSAVSVESWYPLAIPVRVAVGSRVSAGFRQGTTKTVKVWLLAAPVSAVEGA